MSCASCSDPSAQSQPEHGLVVAAHEVFEGSAISALSLPHQNGVVYAFRLSRPFGP